MDALVYPGRLGGRISAIASKSVAHRALICAATCTDQDTTHIVCNAASADIEATLRCVRALGAHGETTGDGFVIAPIDREHAHSAHVSLDVGESGSTLRFLLPVVGALGTTATFRTHGRLSKRPLSPLYEQLVAHGLTLSPQGHPTLTVAGDLTGGTFELPGNISSQYASGLLMAAPLLDDAISVLVSEPVESAPYLHITATVLSRFGVCVDASEGTLENGRHQRLHVAKESRLTTPGTFVVEGDWSNAAFWLAAGALSDGGVEVVGLNTTSTQGDRAIMAAIALLGGKMARSDQGAAASLDSLHGATVNIADTPDLAAPLAAVAAHAHGTTRLTGAARLRLKESNRLATVVTAINALGGQAHAEHDELLIEGRTLTGGTVDAAHDHRIAMMAAVAATGATGPTKILGADCVNKSYPAFFDDFRALGGKVCLEE